MFSTMKLWILGIGSALIAGLYAMLQIESLKRKAAEAKAKRQEAEVKKLVAKQSADDKASVAHNKAKEEIEKKYDDIQKKAIESLDNTPLSNELIQLLQQRGNQKRID